MVMIFSRDYISIGLYNEQKKMYYLFKLLTGELSCMVLFAFSWKYAFIIIYSEKPKTHKR